MPSNCIVANGQLLPIVRADRRSAERREATASGAINAPDVNVAEQHPAAKDRQRHWYLAP